MKIALRLTSVVLGLLWWILNEYDCAKTAEFLLLELLVLFGFKYESL